MFARSVQTHRKGARSSAVRRARVKRIGHAHAPAELAAGRRVACQSAAVTLVGMASSASKRDPGDSARGDLRREDVEAVFREFLGRAATPGDVDVWMQIGSLRTFLDGVLTSEEYAERLKRRAQGEEAHARGSFLNCSIKGWERFTRPPGDVSPDGVVIVGQSGHLFIYGGTNSNVPMYRGQVEMAAGWLDEWRTLMTKRLARARDAERRLVCLVVPEKLAVYADFYPLDLSSSGSRPVLDRSSG
jgi:hypothetical protein